ncbi:MAG TPA: hypothetical protein VEC08_02215 [Nitrososphaerales archaeon]|nr:hypothetical protein [Nitrososphaerales archaeon]
MADLLSIIILVIDLILSIWNSYSAGLSYGMLKRNGGPAWAYTSPVLGLAMGLAGAVYVTAIVVGFVGYLLGLLDFGTVDLLFAYNSLVTGALIVVLGIGVTIQSIYITVRHPSLWNVAGAIYNTFASIWNVFVYMKDFGPLESLINQERRSERSSDVGTLIVVAIIVILLGVLLSYVAFNAGRNHGQGRYMRSNS